MITKALENKKTQNTKNIMNKRASTVKKMWPLYLFLLIPAAFLFVFNYLPMYGVLIAFKDYNFSDGILGSEWNNFEHFKILFTDILFQRALRNTIILSFFRIVICFPSGIVFAILLNEIKNIRFKKSVQTISYLPHFMSWVIVSTFVYQLLSPDMGVLNWFRSLFGLESINFMAKTEYFLPVFILSLLWQSIGWNSIVYLAAITNVNPELYECADLEGANRFQKAWFITIPCIAPTITILFILQMGTIMKAGFDPVFNLYNPMLYEVADIIDTYTYRSGIINARYDYSAAIGLFQNVIGLALVLISNKLSRKVNDYGLF